MMKLLKEIMVAYMHKATGNKSLSNIFLQMLHKKILQLTSSRCLFLSAMEKELFNPFKKIMIFKLLDYTFNKMH